ncbi:molybdopterin-dependent oxidoreductase [Saccharothrix longispora]|uniref:molybdopterin-dependent oxidoreductase n=1 Tax=Saccharothrix longispora TaxID=33920 RepID=UPI0031E88BF4
MERRMSIATHWGSFVAVVDSGRLVRIEPRHDDPAPSPIGPGMVTAAEDSARVLRPAVRKGWLDGEPRAHGAARGADAFVEVSWDQAITLVSDELRRVRSRYGDSAVFGGSYGWASAGRFHHAQGQLHRFLALGGGYTDSRNTYSTAALEVILPHVIGGHPWSYQSRMPMWDEIAENCELVVAFGGLALKNSQINPGGLARHRTRDLQRRCREAGVRFVNVSPIRGDVAGFLDAEWLPVIPNTDTAAMLGIAHTMLVNGWHDEDFLRRCCVGFDRFASYLLGELDGIAKDAAWAARITGIGRDAITDLARRLTTHRSLIMVNYAVQRADHGEQPIWMSVVLAAMAGSMGRPGCGWGAGYATMDATGVARGRAFVATVPEVPNPVPDFIPVARIADALLRPGEVIDYDGGRLTLPELRLVYWCGENPFHHHQDLHRLTRAWQVPDTVVVHEAWWNTSAKFADIVLPVATSLERDDFAAGFSDPPPRRDAEGPRAGGRVAYRSPHLRCPGRPARVRAGVHGVALGERVGPAPLRADQGRARWRRRLAGLRRLLAALHRRAAGADRTGSRQFRGPALGPATFSPGDAVGPDRDLLGGDRLVRLRRLRRAPDVVRTGGVARRRSVGPVPAALDLEPARLTPAQPVRQRGPQPRFEDPRS